LQRTQPSGKKGHLKIKNLATAYEQHYLNPIAVSQPLPGQLVTRHKSFVIEHHLNGHIQLAAVVQQDFAHLVAASLNNIRYQICYGPVSHFQLDLFAD
jgi:hypothetical protein